MAQHQRWTAVLKATMGCVFFAFGTCGFASLPSAVAPEIRDDGKFFSSAALKKADARVREIYRLYDRDVLVETFATVPASDADKVKTMDEVKRKAYFQD
jgi:hypothetical protein